MKNNQQSRVKTVDDPIDLLRGIGPKMKTEMDKLGIYVVRDLLEYYPFRYEDRTLTEARELIDGERVTVSGAVVGRAQVERRGRKSRTLVTLNIDGVNYIRAVWFNQPYLANQLQPERTLSVTGKYQSRFRQITVAHHEFADVSQAVHTGKVVPVYVGTYALKTTDLRKWIRLSLDTYRDSVEDHLPVELREKYRLISREQAYEWIHFPQSSEQLTQAKRRLIFEEFFLYQLKLQLFRKQYKTNTIGIAHSYNRQLLRNFVDQLGFQLTSAQRRVIKEILADMESEHPMYRLLHGDVGSGKTIVATVALLANWTSQYQATLMVPTEILAEQHFETISLYTRELGVRICLLKGKLTKKEREALREAIKCHEYDIIIGTHALIQEDIEFADLGLVVIDEQHRFGVEQRALLHRKGQHPDVLTMTATPIPRTMAMTIFGDLDVSTIDEMPSDRKKIQTEWYAFSKEEFVLKKVQEILDKQQQVYIVCPLIEESEMLEAEDAEQLYERMKQSFSGSEVGLLHGRLSSQIKDQIMSRFVAGEINILVATTVIEVGINVPNASAIIIYNADRFGLAQLHQLRGRVGRSDQQAFCYLLADAKGEIAKQRMQVMVQSNDGFYIAEKDLQLRGPGEIFGKRQSGLPEFKIGNIIDDFSIMEVARKEASRYANDDADRGNKLLIDFYKQDKKGSNFLA